MKKILMSLLLVIGLVTPVFAQPIEPVLLMQGPTSFNIIVTEEYEVSEVPYIKKIVNKTERFTGEIRVYDVGHPMFKMIEMESDNKNIFIRCRPADPTTGQTKMVGASTWGDATKKTVNDKFYVVAGCGIVVEDSGGTAEGNVFLDLVGTQKRSKGNVDPEGEFYESIKLTGSKMRGGMHHYNGELSSGVVFKATFSATLLPPTP